jgi:hypothetical protein
MGEDFDFFDTEGVADPCLVKGLETSDTPPSNPTALARILDERCGHILQFQVTFKRENYPALRRRTHERLVKIVRLSNELLAEDTEEDPIFRFSASLHDLIPTHVSEVERLRMIREISRATLTLACAPLIENLAGFRGRSSLHHIQRTVTEAVAEYWVEIEGTEFAGGVVRGRKSAAVVKRNTAAGLLKSVFGALNIEVTDSQIETLMKQAK